MIQIRELFIDGGRYSDRKRFNITDRKQPYFSWAAVSDIDGDHQSAYEAGVFLGKEELWHSGRIESGEQGVRYDGKTLPAGRILTLVLRIRGSRGETSEPFTASFVCGEADGWKGSWITSGTENGRAVLYFRRDFRTEKPVAEACLFVSGIGYHTVTVNGERPDDAVMDPAFSDYTKSCYYAVLTNKEKDKINPPRILRVCPSGIVLFRGNLAWSPVRQPEECTMHNAQCSMLN